MGFRSSGIWIMIAEVRCWRCRVLLGANLDAELDLDTRDIDMSRIASEHDLDDGQWTHTPVTGTIVAECHGCIQEKKDREL